MHPFHEGMLDELEVKYDARGNVAADTRRIYRSSAQGIAGGHTRRGNRLIVWAIREGRHARARSTNFSWAAQSCLASATTTELPRSCLKLVAQSSP